MVTAQGIYTYCKIFDTIVHPQPPDNTAHAFLKRSLNCIHCYQNYHSIILHKPIIYN